MAMKMDDGGYLGAYRRFFVDFVKRMNPEDQLPVKMTGHDVTEREITGEIIDMTLQYLDPKDCPPSLQSHLIRVVIDEMLTICRQQPESCGLKPQDNTYAPLKLMQAVTGKVNEICKRYLENSRLALLPPPLSIPLPLVTVSAIKNSRRKMEDRHVILHDLNTIFNIKDECVNYYAVFDGHAGQDAAIYCAAHLHQYLSESAHYPADMERALRDAFVTTDAYFIQKSKKHSFTSGATAVCAVIYKRKLYVAWAGDSQVALVKRGTVTQLVNRHRPDRNDERDRVEKMGGTVLHFGTWRVNGHLAVSRAIGDAQYKPYVTADPEICCIMLDGIEDFLIVACDGLWDFVCEEAAAMIVYQQIYRDPYNLVAVTNSLIEYSKKHGSTDNITAIVVFLTPPIQIATRPLRIHPLLADVHLDNMDEDNRYLSNTNGEYEVQTSFVKQAQSRTNGSNFDDETSPFSYRKSSSGKRENGSVGYDDADDDDLGPETDVDAVDDAAEINTLSNISRELFPDKDTADDFHGGNTIETIDDDSPMTPIATKSRQNELIAEPENVGDSEDSDDEWNYYKVNPDKEEDANKSVPSELKVESKSVDDKLLNENELKLQQDELFVSEKEQQQQLEDNEIDSCSDSGAESEREVCSNELINTEISEKKTEIPVATQIPEDNSEDMDFQLNPDAAEFVPVSPIIPSRLMDRPIAGSPLKQTPNMDDINLPSSEEFCKEANHRPHEIEDKEEINSSNGDFFTENNTNEFGDKPKMAFNLDESEVSSTRAEFGDESTASFLTTTDYPKNDGMDGSFTDSCPGTCDNESMMMSFGPGTFNPLSNPVDLNAVHDLSDSDLCDPEDQTLPSESQQGEWLNDLNKFINHEEREAHSPDVHPELVNLISPESDQPPHSVPFPDHQEGDLLDTSSPVKTDNIDEFHDEVENVTSEVAAMNLKNEQLSEVRDENVLNTSALSDVNDETEKTKDLLQMSSHTDDLLSLAPQVSNIHMEADNYSSPGLQSSSSSEHCSDEIVEILSPEHEKVEQKCEVETSFPTSDVENDKEDLFENKEKVSPHVEVFENPLNTNFISQLEEQLPCLSTDDTDEDIEIKCEDDDGPICPQFDPPTGDPFSRSLSPTPESQQNHEIMEEHNSPVVQTQIPDSDIALKLSESLQEFTGLESELTPLTNGNATKAEIQAPETAISKPIVEDILEEKQQDAITPLLIEGIETPAVEKSIVTSQDAAIAATVAAAATVGAAAGAVATATTATKSKTAVKSPQKTVTKTATTKSTNKLSPTSPTKTLSTASRPSSSPITRKTTTNTTARPKPTESVPKSSVSANKSPATKPAAKPMARTNAAPKLKSTTLKPSSGVTEKKPSGTVTTNGEAKPATAKLTSKPKTSTTTITTTTGVAPKSQVKSTTSTRPLTASAIKSKPAVSSTTSKVTTKTSSVTSTVGAAARPKTAPATLGVANKSRVQTTTKSPVLDKQIKETANKQISSSRTSTTTTATRVSRASTLSTTATTTTTTSARRTSTTAPSKKSVPTTRMSAKSATAVSKTTTRNGNVKTKIQNGVCEMKESKVISEATTTVTTINEQDLPQKDTSPVEPTTDNQLLITAD